MRRLIVWIVFLALGLRLIFLGSHPAGFTPDEASFGYDAYCLLKTGKDQWGQVLPLTLKSFGDGKMPLYGYLAIPSVAIFGLNEAAVRLPNVILGTLAVLATYLLVKEWRKKEDEALMAAFLLAVSPWQVSMSRGAFEANLTTLLLPLGVWLLMRGIKKRKWMMAGGVFLGLNLFSYHAARLVTPLVVGGLIWEYRKEGGGIGEIGKKMALFGVLLAVAFWTYFTGAGARVASAGIFSLASEAGRNRYAGVMVGMPDWVERGFNNKLTHLADLFGQNYVSYFSPQFLFTSGPGEYTYGMVPGRGVLYLIEVVFLGGFIWMLVNGKVKKCGWLIWWLVVAPIPAALTIGPGYAANRAAVMMPAMQIMSGVGAMGVYQSLKRKKLWLYGLGGVWLVMFVFFVEDYWVQQKARGAKDMIYGVGEVLTYVKDVGGGYEKILISKKISEPQIYVAFYNKVDPSDYQAAAREWGFDEQQWEWVDQMPEYRLGKYVFKNIDWKVDSKESKVLLVGRPEEFGDGVHILKKVVYPNRKDAYWIVSLD